MENFKSIPINADRICEAISKIGYNPYSALLDIIDNSVVAKSEKITINLFIKEGTSINNSKNIRKIQVIDNGRGMSDDGIDKALQLGSNVEYEKNSLSKYGLGLKSAGFSLGNRIEVFSKKANNYSSLKFLDREIIREQNQYGIKTELLNKEQKKILENYNSGTVITIKDIVYSSRISANKIAEKLKNKAGVHYYDILKENNLTIIVNIYNSSLTPLKSTTIVGKDILFWDIALHSFEKEKYNGKLPCKVLNTEFENPLNRDGEKIKIKATIFPMDKMKNFLGFSTEERNLIKSFDIGAQNSGFYFYRNGRLIKWGEKLFINRKYGFRARIVFSTEHDDLFDVDVSKQQLSIPEDIENTITTLVRTPINQSDELFTLCNQIISNAKSNDNEGSKFNEKNTDLEEDNVELYGENKKEAIERKEKLEKDSDVAYAGQTPEYENEETKEIFKKIRYWENARGMNLWESGIDTVEGTYALISKKHSYYDQILSKFSSHSPYRQAFEAIFYSLAVGQNSAIQVVQNAEYDIVKKAFDTFIRQVSIQLDGWVTNNWDIFEDED